MKINKLFHWLYAFLMFLPVFFVAGRTLYTIFNENAKDSYYGETINEEIDTKVSYLNLEEDKTYYFINTITTDFSSEYGTSNYIFANNVTNISGFNSNVDLSSTQKIRFFLSTDYISLIFIDGNNDNITSISLNAVTITFSFKYMGVPTTFNSGVLSHYDYFYIRTFNDYSYLDNAFEYSVNQINESPLFGWATDSFLAEPITYVTDLFSMPSNSPVITLFSYWLTVSLCWLVFDLVMYVPLLAHRWLDKGGIS